MRTMDIKIGTGGKRTVTLRASFTASIKMCDQIADPLTITREAMMEFQFMEQGLPYDPKIALDSKTIIAILLIGAQEEDPGIDEDQFREDCFDYGLAFCKLYAAEYVTLLVEPGTEIPGERNVKDGVPGKS